MPNTRRSLTIAEDNDQRIQRGRAMFLSLGEHRVDMDYTSMTNLLIELGDLLLNSNWTQTQVTVELNKVMTVIKKYASTVALKDAALGDQFQDYFINNLPKIFEIYQQSQQVKQPQPQQKQAGISYSR